MDKILSARVDEAILKKLSLLAKQLGSSKKAIIEKAIMDFANRLDEDQKIDELEQTLGAWQREESPQELRKRVRREFESSMERHHK